MEFGFFCSFCVNQVLDAHSGPVQFTSRFLLEAGMHSHAISLKRESLKAAAVLWLARVVLRNPSYIDWTGRADVKQLKQLIRDNPCVQAFYAQCSTHQKSKIVFVNKEDTIRTRLDKLNVSSDSSFLSYYSIMSRSASLNDSGIDSMIRRKSDVLETRYDLKKNTILTNLF